MVSTLQAEPEVNALLPNTVDSIYVTKFHAKENTWGFLPVLCLSNALAFTLLAVANTASRNGYEYASALFWASLLLIFVPTALRLVSISASRQERIGLVILLGLSLYMVKVLHSPLDFTFHDEFLHWQTANNILETRHLFTDNPILPVSPQYPGLEIIVTAFSNLSGLSVVESGTITLAIARVAFMLALFLFYEHIGGSAQIGGVATLLYTANSNFVYFDSQFSYESLSLPFAMTILYVVASRDDGYERNFLQKLALAAPLIIVVAMTHHLTGYVLIGFLALWTLFSPFRKMERSSWLTLALLTLTTLVAVIGWNLWVGETTNNYLGPVFRSGISEVISLITDGGGRELFRNEAGGSSPILERYVAIGAVICILLLLPVGILQILLSPFRQRPLASRITMLSSIALQSWRRYRNSAAALALAFIVVLHPLMQAFRLTSTGWEIANRSSEFLFWAIAFVLAVSVTVIGAFNIPKPIWLACFGIWASIIFIGGSISGWPPWARQPSSYLVSADSRSIKPEGVLAARWVGEHLPADSRMSSDRINTLLMSIYGNQRLITHLADDLYLASVFFSPTFGPSERHLLDEADVEYLVVDSRLSDGLPLVGVYFENGEPQATDPLTPIDPEALAKFDDVELISRIFDSGSIKIYAVGELDETS
ncbi:MAG: hypothetical protein H7175_26910 [Burkholderiales bacterium]|nr:hypothetical protein [Anaerolineae bacterium]